MVERLLNDGWRVLVVDNMDPFYPRSIKEANIEPVRGHVGYRFIEGDFTSPAVLRAIWDPADPFDVIVHLAAKAGVRPSMADPAGYHRVNVTGTLDLLNAAVQWKVPHFVLASSSSVYGEDPDVPWVEDDCSERPISPYAATKLMAEHYARLFARLHGSKVTVLRFFTVFGPRQRPDLAIHQFTRKIIEGTPIQRFGDGGTSRDYTYVEDIVDGVVGAIHRSAGGAFEVYNLGNSQPTKLADLIRGIEQVVGRSAVIDQRPEQPGDVPRTCADISKAALHLGYAPRTDLHKGLHRFFEWYQGQRR